MDSKKTNDIAILLSTYNGDKYLRNLLDSLLIQTYKNFKIFIRDDGSSDSTVSILEAYSQKNSNEIILLTDDYGNIGVAKSFKLLMKNVDSDFYLFADQDDIWEFNKIEKLIEIAQLAKTEEPYLVFSNMSIFYSSEKENTDFFKKYFIKDKKIENGLFRGVISGCLMLVNNKAKLKSLELNQNSNMLHDWDMYISTYLFGKIELTHEKLIKHRIHENNFVGENLEKSTLILIKDLIKYLFKSEFYRKIVFEYYFEYVSNCIMSIDNNLRLKKEFFTENEINNLSYFKRKKWYLKHFNPFIYGKINGLLILMTF